MSASASLRMGDAVRAHATAAGDWRRSDLVLLGLLSVALHAGVWQMAVRETPPPDIEAKPLPIEIQLVAPPAPKPVAPPPQGGRRRRRGEHERIRHVRGDVDL